MKLACAPDNRRAISKYRRGACRRLKNRDTTEHCARPRIDAARRGGSRLRAGRPQPPSHPSGMARHLTVILTQ
ncbi:hypothetical protein GPZ74_12145 [Burkholderia pseudomallei]|nr:hypothetical protein [Burkholderia pseudomallei]MWA25010.1 hypothetical protein [Burkholderia pseudomallei]NAX51183.1 hypothetical protein [Burkholderia pseudomallei]NAY56719.1 hypothetical protein [Burkholderia pseudomallei]NAY62755.1 hypothetical protein [Burkholderia pseudomallei]